MEQVRDVEIVYAGLPEGKARIEFLRTQNYICEPRQAMNYICYAFPAFNPKDEKIVNRIEQKLRTTKIVFGENASEPILVNKGIDYTEWRVNQPIEFAGRAWLSYRYVEAQGVARIFPGEETTEMFLVENGALELSLLGSIDLTANGRHWLEYLALGTFQN